MAEQDPTKNEVEIIPFNPLLPTKLKPMPVKVDGKEEWMHETSNAPLIVGAYFAFKSRQKEYIESGREVSNEKILAELKTGANPLEGLNFDTVYENLEKLDQIFEIFGKTYPNLLREIEAHSNRRNQIEASRKALEKEFGRGSEQSSEFRINTELVPDDLAKSQKRLSMMLDGIHQLDPTFDINIFIR